MRTLFSRTRVAIDGSPCEYRLLTNQSSVETGSMPKRYNARVLLSLGLDSCDGEGGGGPTANGTDFFQHLSFLMARRKGSSMLPGGGWVPSLDGTDPEGDEKVLIRTAIRTVKLMTGLDLTSCQAWKRLYVIHYHRPEEIVAGKQYPEQEEITVVYLVDLFRAKVCMYVDI